MNGTPKLFPLMDVTQLDNADSTLVVLRVTSTNMVRVEETVGKGLVHAFRELVAFCALKLY